MKHFVFTTQRRTRLLRDADADDAVVQVQDPTGSQRGPLDHQRRQQHVDAHAAVTVPL